MAKAYVNISGQLQQELKELSQRLENKCGKMSTAIRVGQWIIYTAAIHFRTRNQPPLSLSEEKPVVDTSQTVPKQKRCAK